MRMNAHELGEAREEVINSSHFPELLALVARMARMALLALVSDR